MASGRLANVFLTTTANTVVYTVPANNLAVVTISAVNISPTLNKLTIALTNNAVNPDISEYLEYTVPVNPDGGVYERSGVIVSPNMKIVASALAANAISLSVWGFEQAP